MATAKRGRRRGVVAVCLDGGGVGRAVDGRKAGGYGAILGGEDGTVEGLGEGGEGLIR